MTRMRWFAVVSCVLLAAAACGSFGEGDGPVTSAPDGSTTPDGASPGGDAGGSDAATRDASCHGGRDAGNSCGAVLCPRGQACCLEATQKCTVTSGVCGTTQVNCASPNECDNGLSCCQVNGETVGTRCMQVCSFGVPLCEKDEDCEPNEYCRPPDPTRRLSHWHCAACPP
jgi:hypothetical protein